MLPDGGLLSICRQPIDSSAIKQSCFLMVGQRKRPGFFLSKTSRVLCIYDDMSSHFFAHFWRLLWKDFTFLMVAAKLKERGHGEYRAVISFRRREDLYRSKNRVCADQDGGPILGNRYVARLAFVFASSQTRFA